MFCRLEILTRDGPSVPASQRPSVRVIATRYLTGVSLAEIKETADRVCQKVNAPGYRITDLHTERVEEDWQDV